MRLAQAALSRAFSVAITLSCIANLVSMAPAMAGDAGPTDHDSAPPPAQDLLKIIDRDQADRTAVQSFLVAPGHHMLWIDRDGLTAKGKQLIAVLQDANTYGLDASDFRIPTVGSGGSLSDDMIEEAEKTLAIAALKYARYARGGRIADPAGQLNSNLDRRPQWIAPETTVENLSKADDPGAFLVSLHPKHPQFDKLRALYVQALPKTGGPLSVSAKRLRANMEMWRWMPDDMGEMHILNNIPEFMQRVYKDGQVIRAEKIVAGMIDKQTSIFSRPLKYVVLRPKWRVPESIKVNELWPSLIRGGGYMRQYDLQLETKDGTPVDYRKFDWRITDVRNFEVTQASGPKSVLGRVKFSFPSQHTIFMHDTPDKWMFRNAERTHSHGCLRVWKPMELAEMILKEDKGWDKAKVAELNQSGPLNNEIEITKRIPVHLTYFTAWVDDTGTLKTFRDVYRHERRVTQALDGAWDAINKGRDHLAPVAVNFNPSAVAARAQNRASLAGYAQRRAIQKEATLGDIIGDALGIGN